MGIKIQNFQTFFELQKFEDKCTERVSSGSVEYMAPEMIQHEQGYSFEVDAWSLGIICYQLRFGNTPFFGLDELKMLEAITQGEWCFPEGAKVSEEFIDFVSRLLVLDPSKRLILDDMKVHPFLVRFKYELKGLSVSSLKYRPEPSWVRQFFADFVPTRLPTQLQLQQLVKQDTVIK